MADEVALNISVIRTYDEYCADLLDTSSSTHLYSFQSSTNSWIKSKIGGVFFLYKRSKAPFYSFMILNRKSSDMNHMESISSSMQIQLHSPFMLYKTGNGEIFSLWFYTPNDCVRIAEKVGRLITDLGGIGLRSTSTAEKHKIPKQMTSSSTPVNDSLNQLMNIIKPTNGPVGSRTPHSQLKQVSPISKASQSPNLFDLLHKAEADFKSKTHPTPDKPDDNITAKLLGLRTACKATSTSLGDSAILDNSRPTVRSQSRSGGHISLVELEQQLLQYPNSCNSGDEPTNGLSADDQLKPDFLLSNHRSLEIANQRMAITAPSGVQLSDLDPGYIEDIDEDDLCQNLVPPVPSDRQSSLRKQRRHIKHRDGVTGEIVHKTTIGKPVLPSSQSALQERDDAEGHDMQEPILMTPDMFSQPAASLPYPPRTKLTSTLSSHTTPTNQSPAAGLTKNQLREALVHLLRTNDDFLDAIHQAYLDSLQRRLARD